MDAWQRVGAGWAVAGLLALGIGCASESGMPNSGAAPSKSMGASLYERLGKEAITAVVDDFVTRVANDGRINANLPMPIFPD